MHSLNLKTHWNPPRLQEICPFSCGNPPNISRWRKDRIVLETISLQQTDTAKRGFRTTLARISDTLRSL